eukprot:Opistho-2@92455
MSSRRDDRIRELTSSNTPTLSRGSKDCFTDKNRLDTRRLQSELRLENARRESITSLYKNEEKELIRLKERLDKCKAQSTSYHDLPSSPMPVRRATARKSSLGVNSLLSGSVLSIPHLNPGGSLSCEDLSRPSSSMLSPRQLSPKSSSLTNSDTDVRPLILNATEPSAPADADTGDRLIARRGRMSLPTISPSGRPASPKANSMSPVAASQGDVSTTSLYVIPNGSTNRDGNSGPTSPVLSPTRRQRPSSPCPKASLISVMSTDSGICIDSPRPFPGRRGSRASLCSVSITTPSVGSVAEMEAEFDLEFELANDDYRRGSV